MILWTVHKKLDQTNVRLFDSWNTGEDKAKIRHFFDQKLSGGGLFGHIKKTFVLRADLIFDECCSE